MPDALAFESVTARFSLPLLFAAQAGKEVFHNEALVRIDALLHGTIQGEANDPPENAEDGQCWLIGPLPTGAWVDRGGLIAMRQAGQWLFAGPVEGMRIFDRSSRQFAVFSGAWEKPADVPEPSGGKIVDSEARAAIGAVLLALRASGFLPSA